VPGTRLRCTGTILSGVPADIQVSASLEHASPRQYKRGVQSRQEAASDQGELQDTGALRYQGIPGRACLSEALVPLRSRLGDAPIGSRRNLDRAHEALYAGWGDKLQGGRVGQFLPLLLVKSPGSRGPLKISQAPASLIDVRATIL
jgi:hypothetical protein